MFSSNSGVDIPSEVCYNAPNLGWKEPIYVVMMPDEDEDWIHGLTKSKDHAEQVAKEVGGYVKTTQWLDPP